MTESGSILGDYASFILTSYGIVFAGLLLMAVSSVRRMRQMRDKVQTLRRRRKAEANLSS